MGGLQIGVSGLILWLSGMALAAGTATLERARQNGVDIAAGDSVACALFETGLRCWGDNSTGQLDLPPLSHPRAVTVGWNHVCALDDGGVKCWGDNSLYQLMVPPLVRPRTIAAGWHHTCALDDTGVRCWGDNTVAQLEVPALSHPRALAAGGYRTCATDHTGVVCFGDFLFMSSPLPPEVKSLKEYAKDPNHLCQQLYRGIQCWIGPLLYVTRTPPEAPSFSQLREVAVGISGTCALDDHGVQCWGEDFNGQLTPPPLKRPRALSAGGGHFCALDDDGMHCWGANFFAQFKAPSLFAPRAIATSLGASCALDGNGIRCWGDDADGLNAVPNDVAAGSAFGTIGGPFLLTNLDRGLVAISKLVYRYKRDFLLKTAGDLAEVPAEGRGGAARLFVLRALVPVLEDGSSPVMQQIVLPRLHHELASLTDGRRLSEIPLTADTLRLALSLSANALVAARPFIGSAEERAQLEEMLAQLASVVASLPGGSSPGPQLLRRAREALDSHRSLIELLMSQRKTRGFGLMLLAIEGALDASTAPRSGGSI